MTRPALNTVKIEDKVVYQNGTPVARIEGTRSEVWLVAITPEFRRREGESFLGRFKYGSPSANCKDMAKWMFARFSLDEILAMFAEEAPLKALAHYGYQSLNIRKANKVRIAQGLQPVGL